MQIRGIDHFVITTRDLAACLAFYEGFLGMEHRMEGGHHNLYFPGGKISLHTRPSEFRPAAEHPTVGAQDFCLVVGGGLETVREELARCGAPLLDGIVPRHGAQGAMRSIYLRDPDGNLVELCEYEPPDDTSRLP